MRTFKGKLGIGISNAYQTFYFEVEDDATEDEIEDEAFNSACEYMSYGYEEVDAN